MEFSDYLHILRRRWRGIVVVLLLGLGLAAALNIVSSPQYAAKARLFVSTTPTTASDAYQGGLFTAQRVSSYADVASSQELAEAARKRLDEDGKAPGLSADDLTDMVSATVEPESVVVTLQATAPSPTVARDIAQAYADELQKMIQDLETPDASDTPLLKATIIDRAKIDPNPVSPKKVLNFFLFGVVSLVLGTTIVVLRDMLDTSVKTEADVSHLPEAPPLMGTIAFDSGAVKRPLVTDLSPHAPLAESFRVLRTNMQFADVDSPHRTFVVTSALPGEGKSSTAANLAITMASAGFNVVLVDCDLRRPRLGALLSLDDAVGLTTVLLGQVGLEEALQRHSATSLTVLTSGRTPPNPAELLQTKVMGQVLEALRSRFDVIILDSPPLLPVTDAALLAAQSDGALLVVRHGTTKREAVRVAIDRLASVDAVPVGFVLNRVPANQMGAYGSYGYGYYGPPPRKRGPARASSRRAKRAATAATPAPGRRTRA